MGLLFDFLGLRRIKRQGIPQLIDEHDQVWHW
jgi:hypothetical protein